MPVDVFGGPQKRKRSYKRTAGYQYSPGSSQAAMRIFGAGFPALPVPQLPAGAPSTPTNNPYDLANDPLYQLSISQQKAGLAELGGGLRESIAQMLIRFGDPSMLGQGASVLAKAGLDLDPQTLAMINESYKSGNSTLAQADHASGLRREAITNRLAARNVINSGDLGYLEGEETRQQGNILFGLRGQLLDALSGSYGRFIEGRNSLQSAVNAAMGQAYQNALNAPPPPVAAPALPVGAGGFSGGKLPAGGGFGGGKALPRRRPAASGSWIRGRKDRG